MATTKRNKYAQTLRRSLLGPVSARRMCPRYRTSRPRWGISGTRPRGKLVQKHRLYRGIRTRNLQLLGPDFGRKKLAVRSQKPTTPHTPSAALPRTRVPATPSVSHSPSKEGSPHRFTRDPYDGPFSDESPPCRYNCTYFSHIPLYFRVTTH
jgi:hypothetical protein